MTLWPICHRLVAEENGKRKVQYNLNVTRNVFDINSVFNKIPDSNRALVQLKKNKKILVELLREVNKQTYDNSKES